MPAKFFVNKTFLSLTQILSFACIDTHTYTCLHTRAGWPPWYVEAESASLSPWRRLSVSSLPLRLSRPSTSLPCARLRSLPRQRTHTQTHSILAENCKQLYNSRSVCVCVCVCVSYLCSQTLVQARQHAVINGGVNGGDQRLQLVFALRQPAGDCDGFRSCWALGSTGGCCLRGDILFSTGSVHFHGNIRRRSLTIYLHFLIITRVWFVGCRLLLIVCICLNVPSWMKDIRLVSVLI